MSQMASSAGGGSGGNSPSSSQDEQMQWDYAGRNGTSYAAEPRFMLHGNESQQTTPSPETYTNSLHSLPSSGNASPSRRNTTAPKAKPRRKRPSRRVPTTMLEASSSQFRGLVQQLTGAKPETFAAGEATSISYTSSTNHLPRHLVETGSNIPTQMSTQPENLSLQAQYAAQARSRSASNANFSQYNTIAAPMDHGDVVTYQGWNYGHENPEWM